MNQKDKEHVTRFFIHKIGLILRMLKQKKDISYKIYRRYKKRLQNLLKFVKIKI